MYFKLSLLFILVLLKVSCDDDWKTPDFCRNYECPKYKVVTKLRNDIEVREYEESKWASVSMMGMSYNFMVKKAYRSLASYFNGANTKDEKIKMTIPVVEKLNSTVVFTETEPMGTMLFYLGYRFQKDVDAPKPREEKLSLVKLVSKKYAVIQYGGYSKQSDQEEHLRKLGTYLTEKKMKYVTDYFFFAGYDSPLKFWNRHNEIWIELMQ